MTYAETNSAMPNSVRYLITEFKKQTTSRKPPENFLEPIRGEISQLLSNGEEVTEIDRSYTEYNDYRVTIIDNSTLLHMLHAFETAYIEDLETRKWRTAVCQYMGLAIDQLTRVVAFHPERKCELLTMASVKKMLWDEEFHGSIKAILAENEECQQRLFDNLPYLRTTIDEQIASYQALPSEVKIHYRNIFDIVLERILGD